MNPFKTKPIKWWRRQCKSLFFFCIAVLATAFLDKFNNFGELHKLLCNFLISSKRLRRKKLISIFRGSFKTTVLLGYTLWLFVWHIVKGKPISICYNTATKDNTEAFMNDFRYALLECEFLHDIFPELPRTKEDYKKHGKWTKNRVEFKWVKFHVASLETKQVSRHYTVYINDDLVDDDNAYSEKERETVKRKWKYQKSIITRYEKFEVGMEVDCGTPYHSQDLMSELMEKRMGKNYDKFVIPYSIDEDGKTWNPHLRRGYLTFPEVYEWEDFEKTYDEQGDSIFSTQYKLKVVEEADVLCKEEWIKYHRGNLPLNYIRHMVIDPAGTEKSSNTATGITICDFDKAETVYVIFANQFWITPVQLIEKIEELKEKYAPDEIFIEREKYSITIADTIEHLAPKLNLTFVMPEIGILSRRMIAKTDRIRRLKQWFNNGKILLGHEQTELRNQLLEYPSGNKDILDSLAYQIQAMDTPKGEVREDKEYVVEESFEEEMNKFLAQKEAMRINDDAFY